MLHHLGNALIVGELFGLVGECNCKTIIKK
jgi:hypothetical protein